MTNKEKFPTARQTRIALLVLLPLAILGGPHAVAWADLQLKTWTAKEPLKAADLNAEFAKIKAAVDKLQPEIYIGTPLEGQANLNSTAGTWSQIPEITLTVTPKYDGQFKVHGSFVVYCRNPKASEIPVKLGITWTNGATITGDLKLNSLVTASPAVNGNTKTDSNFSMHPALIAPLKAGQTYVFLLRSYAQDCQNPSISGDSDGASHALLIAERIAD